MKKHVHILDQSTLAAAKKAYLAGKPHSLMATGTKPHNLGRPVATRHADGDNLYLAVSATGAMSFVSMYVYQGKRHERGLGSYTGEGRAISVSLSEARDKNKAFKLSMKQQGFVHSTKERRKVAKAAGTTFEQMMELHIAACIKGKVWARPDSEKKHWEGQLNKNAKDLMAMPVDAIETSDIVAVLSPIWPSRGAEVLANRIRAILNTAEGQGHFKGRKNPADKDAIKGHLKGQAKTDGRIALPFDRMPAFLAQLLAGGSVEELGLAFLALTAVRSSEVRLARREEVVGDRWTIPAERMGKSLKSGKAKAHVVPLSRQALAIIERLPVVEGNPYLFPGKDGGPLDVLAFDKLWEAMGLRGVAHIHGLRKTFRTHMGEKHEANGNLTYAPQLLEFCLAHVLKGSEAAYMTRTAVDARAIIMQAYADEAFDNKKGPAQLKAVA